MNHLEWLGPMANGLMDLPSSLGQQSLPDLGCHSGLIWDVTFAPSYLSASSTKAGAVAELAAYRKCAKYPELTSTHIYCPLAFETLKPICGER